MEINRKNFEAYLLDRMEGRLSDALEQELREFLAMNPDCAFEIEGEEPLEIPHETLQFPDKDSLRKNLPDSSSRLTPNNFDLFSIARMEGDLSDGQVNEHTHLMEHQPQLKFEWESWQQTRLNPGTISYPGKAALKKGVPGYRKIRWITVFSTAAAVALISIVLVTRERGGGLVASEEPFSLPLIEEDEIVVPVSPPHEGQLFTPVAQAVPEERIGMDDQTGIQQQNEETVPVSTRSAEREDDQVILADRPLRAALAANTIPAPVDQGNYDRIRPLQLPATPVHMSGVSLSRLAEMDLQEVVEIYAEENDFSLWTIANAGIRGINRVTGADIALFAARDDEGEISGFKLKSKRLNITTPLQKED